MNERIKAIDLRETVLRMLCEAGSGHTGSALSCIEIMMALYYHVMRVDPKNPQWADRDRFAMSKGHACPTLYAILADLGFFPASELWRLRKIDSWLQGHPDMHKVPGVDVSVGSLGQGASVALGMAMAAKVQHKDWQVYSLIGDGESQEGMVWEMAMSAAHYRLDNLTVLLDHNGLQIDGTNDEVMSLGDVCAKFAAFGFAVDSVDGHDIDALTAAMKKKTPGKPHFIECRTTKGKGVSFIENQVGWHGKAPNREELAAALAELEAQRHG